MSKLAERVPAIPDTQAKLELGDSVISSVADEDGRINVGLFTNAIKTLVDGMTVSTDLIVEEGRKAAAQQVVSAWVNSRVIKLDRAQRLPVYQTQFGFAGSYFKVGSTLIPAAGFLNSDFEMWVERIDRGIANRTADRAIVVNFWERAKPGLSRGENLVEQFEAGTLELHAATQPALEEGEGDDEQETEA